MMTTPNRFQCVQYILLLTVILAAFALIPVSAKPGLDSFQDSSTVHQLDGDNDYKLTFPKNWFNTEDGSVIIDLSHYEMNKDCYEHVQTKLGVDLEDDDPPLIAFQLPLYDPVADFLPRNVNTLYHYLYATQSTLDEFVTVIDGAFEDAYCNEVSSCEGWRENVRLIPYSLVIESPADEEEEESSSEDDPKGLMFVIVGDSKLNSFTSRRNVANALRDNLIAANVPPLNVWHNHDDVKDFFKVECPDHCEYDEESDDSCDILPNARDTPDVVMISDIKQEDSEIKHLFEDNQEPYHFKLILGKVEQNMSTRGWGVALAFTGNHRTPEKPPSILYKQVLPIPQSLVNVPQIILTLSSGRGLLPIDLQLFSLVNFKDIESIELAISLLQPPSEEGDGEDQVTLLFSKTYAVPQSFYFHRCPPAYERTAAGDCIPSVCKRECGGAGRCTMVLHPYEDDDSDDILPEENSSMDDAIEALTNLRFYTRDVCDCYTGYTPGAEGKCVPEPSNQQAIKARCEQQGATCTNGIFNDDCSCACHANWYNTKDDTEAGKYCTVCGLRRDFDALKISTANMMDETFQDGYCSLPICKPGWGGLFCNRRVLTTGLQFLRPSTSLSSKQYQLLTSNPRGNELFQRPVPQHDWLKQQIQRLLDGHNKGSIEHFIRLSHISQEVIPKDDNSDPYMVASHGNGYGSMQDQQQQQENEEVKTYAIFEYEPARGVARNNLYDSWTELQQGYIEDTENQQPDPQFGDVLPPEPPNYASCVPSPVRTCPGSSQDNTPPPERPRPYADDEYVFIPDEMNSKDTNTGLIVGVVVGVCAFVILLFIIVICSIRYCKKHHKACYADKPKRKSRRGSNSTELASSGRTSAGALSAGGSTTASSSTAIPVQVSSTASGQSNIEPLPEGWDAVTDASGKVFYINKTTQQSQWHHPNTQLDADKTAYGW